MAAARVFALNVHATYACRHSGACCTAGWTIPVEAHLLPLVGAAWLEPDEQGACPRYERRSGLCQLQREHGERMLPESCHHFPRRALHDARGTFVTLSHFCPTAATLLLESTDPLRVVADAAGFPAARGYEGLDAREEWPPLLRRDVLFDHESFGLWERHMVESMDSSPHGVVETLNRLAATAERLRAWEVSQGSLLEWTARHLAADAAAGTGLLVGNRYAEFEGRRAFQRAVEAVPAGLPVPLLPEPYDDLDAVYVAPVWEQMAGGLRRFLAARAFASWTAYQSRGIRTQVAELFMTAAVLRVECVRACAAVGQALNRDSLREAVRATDRLLVHLADRDRLLPWLGKAEDDAPADRHRTR